MKQKATSWGDILKTVRILISIKIIGGGSYDEYKEQAAKIAEKVQENAKILKEKALDWLSTFTQS